VISAELYPTIPQVRTCCRCGVEFRTVSGRICHRCRKPKVSARRVPVSRALSFRERQIVELIREAKLNKEIAWDLHLTEGTVKEYLNRIFRKLDVKNRTQLAIWSYTNSNTNQQSVA
jgi:DNA-binding NarL/FixJ family response regulator